jgi:hypothetical protein
MDRQTAETIAKKWLAKTRKSDERLPALTDSLQVIGHADVYEWTTDGRLALLAGKELWIVVVDLETEDVSEVTVRNVNLSTTEAQLSLTQTYDLDIEKREVTHRWQLEFDGIPTPLEFRDTTGYQPDPDLKPHNPTLDFGWRVAEAVGWTKPSDA